MRLSKIRLQNFRSFKDETILLDPYTCLVGPNGSGKSTVLTALNVFFRNNAATATDVNFLSEEDFHLRDTSSPVVITLTFTDLSEDAQKDLKAYYRQKELVVSAKATWDAGQQAAEVLQYGSRRVMELFAPYFKADEAKAKAAELKAIYSQIKGQCPDLPEAKSMLAMKDALRSFEGSHPDLCELIESTSKFYGWSKGTNRLGKYVQWVYVPAVKDATSEQEEGTKTALGQLLQRTIRSKVSFQDGLDKLKAEIEEKYRDIIAGQQNALDDLQNSIETRLQAWTHARAELRLKWNYNPDKSIVVNEPLAKVSIGEDDFLGEIARLGHGMQRAFLVS